jgi:hypothetical protein
MPRTFLYDPSHGIVPGPKTTASREARGLCFSLPGYRISTVPHLDAPGDYIIIVAPGLLFEFCLWISPASQGSFRWNNYMNRDIAIILSESFRESSDTDCILAEICQVQDDYSNTLYARFVACVMASLQYSMMYARSEPIPVQPYPESQVWCVR